MLEHAVLDVPNFGLIIAFSPNKAETCGEEARPGSPNLPGNPSRIAPRSTLSIGLSLTALGCRHLNLPVVARKSAASLLDHNFVGFALHGTSSPESKATKISRQVTLHDFPFMRATAAMFHVIVIVMG